MKNFSSVIWGVILIICGVLLGGNALDIWHIDIFFPGWWTLFIIIPALVGMKKRGPNMGNSICLIIGIFLLVSAWDFIPWGTLWRLIIPGFCIILGIFILFGMGRNGRNQDEQTEYASGDGKVKAFCSSAEQRLVNEPFCGGRVSAVMGSAVLDLSCAIIEGDIDIDVDVFMGSAEIYLPPYVKVSVDSSPFLGAVENKTNQSTAINAPTVHLSCSAILGGVELK